MTNLALQNGNVDRLMKKKKPIKWDDTWDYNGKKLADGVVEKYATVISESASHGRSYYRVRCPFCKSSFIAYKWSLRGGGKRCPDCKALMGSTFQTFQWEELTTTNEGTLK